MENKAFKQYRRSNIAEMRPYIKGELLPLVSISKTDLDNGSPLVGDMIARNPNDHTDQWLVAEEYFKENFEPLQSSQEPSQPVTDFLGVFIKTVESYKTKDGTLSLNYADSKIFFDLYEKAKEIYASLNSKESKQQNNDHPLQDN